MQVRELFASLSVGELENLSFANEATQTINEDKHAKILLAVNDTVSELHSQYILENAEYTLPVLTGVREYDLKELIGDDFQQLLYVNDDAGAEVFSSLAQPYSIEYLWDKDRIAVSGLSKIKFLDEPRYEEYSVIYQAVPSRIAYDSLGSHLDTEIGLPSILNEALRAGVAYRVYAQMNGENMMNTAMVYQSKFATKVANLEARGLIRKSVDIARRPLRESGFI